MKKWFLSRQLPYHPCHHPDHSHYILQSQWGEVLLFWSSIEQRRKNNLDIPRKPVTVGDSSCLFQPISMCQNVFEAKPRHTINIPLFSPAKSLNFSPQTSPSDQRWSGTFFWSFWGPNVIVSLKLRSGHWTEGLIKNVAVAELICSPFYLSISAQ